MLKEYLYRALRRSEKYTKTDMVHFFSANFWLNFSRFFAIGSGIVLTVAFTRLLTPEQFGTYKYVIAAAGFISTFSLNGLAMATMRAVAQGKWNVIPALVRTGIFWSLPGSVGAVAASIYYFGNGNTELGFGFLFIGITNSVGIGIGSLKNVWQGAGEYKVGMLTGIPKILVPFLVILLTILITKNVVWILFAYFFSNLILSLAGYYFILWWFNVKGSPADVPETIRYAKQITALGFFQIASGQIDQLLLFHFVGPAQLAIYALALAPVNEAQNLLNNFLTIFFRKVAQKTKEEVHKNLSLRLWQMFFASILLVIVYVVSVPFLFTYVFPKYLASIVVSQVLALTILFQFKAVIDTYLMAHGDFKRRSTIILSSQAVEFALFFVLIPLFGLWGAVAATLLSELVAGVIYLGIYLQSTKKSV